MELAILVYIAGFVDDVRAAATLSALNIGSASIFLGMHLSLDKRQNPMENKYIVRGVVVSFILLGCGLLIPKERTIWLMTGAYMGQSVYENVVDTELKADLKTIIKNKVRDYAQEGKK